MAILVFFRFRRAFQEDDHVAQPHRLSSGSSPVTLGKKRRYCTCPLPNDTRVHPTSSGRCCSKDCGCHSRSLRPRVKGARPLWTCLATTGSCARSGRVKRRATPTERMTAREAGACVRQNPRVAVPRRSAVGCGHHIAQCPQLRWPSPPARSRP